MTATPRRTPSLAQLAVIRALAHQSPTSLTGLVERTGMNRSWLSQTVRVLAQQGYVTRTRSATDARRAEISITPQGRAVLPVVKGEAIS
jgi:DNA-binding MarR family transcriptional regulator